MKVVILAGGLGTRLSEETQVRPKPMVEIGGKPILWHIMKGYSCHGFTEFIICLGFKGYVIKEYFINYCLHQSDITVNVGSNTVEMHNGQAEPWRVTLIDTGLETMTGGRLKRVAPYVDGDTFCMTYGDGVADVNHTQLVEFHRSHGADATLTAIQPPGRFGALHFGPSQEVVDGFEEKPVGDGGWINGGFFVLSRRVLDLIKGDDTVWESGPLQRLATANQLRGYRHSGFWQAMDTLRDKNQLEHLWQTGRAPWKIW
jgi:glucose-1-phosphate cytidylyltransferase